MDEPEILEEMRGVVAAAKLGGEPAGWSPKNGDGLILVLPLEVMEPNLATPIIGTTRLTLRAGANTPDRDVSASLIHTLQGKDYKACRVDWRPVAPHVNRCGPSELKGLIVQTGIHKFDANATLGLRRMQTENLPVCIPVDPEPHDYDAFVRFVCRELNVTLTEQILSPPWSAKLF